MSDVTNNALLQARDAHKTYTLGERALEVLRGVSGVAVQYFEARDVVRHPLVQRIVDAYDGAQP